MILILPPTKGFGIKSWFSPGGRTMNQKIRCANPNCRRLFLPDPRVKGQRYCNKKACQRVRKRQWQRRQTTVITSMTPSSAGWNRIEITGGNIGTSTLSMWNGTGFSKKKEIRPAVLSILQRWTRYHLNIF